jgi:hypothetical protein
MTYTFAQTISYSICLPRANGSLTVNALLRGHRNVNMQEYLLDDNGWASQWGREGLRVKYLWETSQMFGNNFNLKTWGKCAVCDRGVQIFQTPSGHFKIVVTRMMTWKEFHAEDSRSLDATPYHICWFASPVARDLFAYDLGILGGDCRIILKGIIRKGG